MLIRPPTDIAASEITPKSVFDRRREILAALAVTAGIGSIGAWAARDARAQPSPRTKLPAQASPLSVLEKQTPYNDATTYNNFYEFGTDKSDPGMHAGKLRTRPWTVSIEGEVQKPMTLGIDELLKLAPLEERVYRLRCVEGWSMVIPWIGYSFAALAKKVEPTSNAKFVEFTSAVQPDTMPGVRSAVLDWPYVEGLRIDEAMHPLTLLTLGMYGEILPNQNGAPVRLVVPWKYGFKSAKSIVKIRFVRQQPVSSWTKSAPQEYGFYSNVNPNVSHPRWSQATERRIPSEGFFAPRRKTLMFNGYESQVASLYTGMDLRKDY
ncbi:MAG TPA: protein-methionine-sulfoxide reductase catalytic subunit MsrP [Burkholderiaceae bacterium]|nr:protein-methionine-sulfoxide reductase catalytic subunit MsrP [Burkholderiaceae bacterium]